MPARTQHRSSIAPPRHHPSQNPFSCDRFVCPGKLIVEGSWQPEAYAAWHRLAWSGMLGAAVILFPTCTLTLQAHQQLLALLRAAHLQGCHVYFEYPSGCPGEVEDLYIRLCQELASHCAQARLWHDKHSIIICSTDCLVSTLASQDDGLGTLSGIASKHCTSILQAPIGVDALIKHMPSCYLPKRPAVCDGAGMFSTADHSANSTSTGPKPLAQLARSFKYYLGSHGLVKHTSNHLSEGKDEPPLSEEHGIALASIIHSMLARCLLVLSGLCRAVDSGRPHKTPWISRMISAMISAPHR